MARLLLSGSRRDPRSAIMVNQLQPDTGPLVARHIQYGHQCLISLWVVIMAAREMHILSYSFSLNRTVCGSRLTWPSGHARS